MSAPQRHSLYWDDFERRAWETVAALKEGRLPPVRRVAVFITDHCNFKCAYCNHAQAHNTMSRASFLRLLDKYGETALFHITGGEPSMVPWLYPLLEKQGEKFRFHLNTNAYHMPPAGAVKRLKVSLDHHEAEVWDAQVGRAGAFNRVVRNIKSASELTTTSITFTMTRKNYKVAPRFAQFAREQFPSLYAIFFSVYKGTDPEFAFTPADADCFFSQVLPQLVPELEEESMALLGETLDEKLRLMQGVRFPQNQSGVCYLSMSERVVAPSGIESSCSHLYRDFIRKTGTSKHEACLYGCNRRLVQFNELVERGLQCS